MKRKVLQSLLLVMSAFTMIFILASCGNDNSNDGGASSATNKSNTESIASQAEASVINPSAAEDSSLQISSSEAQSSIAESSVVESSAVEASSVESSSIIQSSQATSSINIDDLTTYIRVENKIYFGTYPQTNITDDTLIGELNDLVGELPTSTNLYNWKDYEYKKVINSKKVSYMYYQDIDYDNNGTLDYRGVYFTEYRSYQESNGYPTEKIHWFSYDPIEWNIIRETEEKVFILANLILDSQEYYPSSSTSKFDHNEGNGYANNYELSNIRKWLNDNFYNTAFSDLQKDIIEITAVDNSVSSTGQSSNSYKCNNTNDNIFLLSYSEANNFYSTDSNRRTEPTDYAKVQGVIKYEDTIGCHWWLRSPYHKYAYKAYCVRYDGEILSENVDVTYYGVRPACWINL